MFKLLKNIQKSNIGFTLIELTLVLPLVAIIFLLGFNMLFLINRSHKLVNDSFATIEEIRLFQTNIQKEANQARKAELGTGEPKEENADKAVMVKKSNCELHIYTDIDDDNIPELLIYKLEGTSLKRYVKKASNASNKMFFPYEYNNTAISSKTVLTNVYNTDIFGDIEGLKTLRSDQEGTDYRKRALMNLEIKSKNGKVIAFQNYLITKSRANAE